MKQIFTKLHKSKTLIFNTLQAVLIGVEMNFHLLQEQVGTDAYGYWMLGIVTANIVLRQLTTQPLSDK